MLKLGVSKNFPPPIEVDSTRTEVTTVIVECFREHLRGARNQLKVRSWQRQVIDRINNVRITRFKRGDDIGDAKEVLRCVEANWCNLVSAVNRTSIECSTMARPNIQGFTVSGHFNRPNFTFNRPSRNFMHGERSHTNTNHISIVA